MSHKRQCHSALSLISVCAYVLQVNHLIGLKDDPVAPAPLQLVIILIVASIIGALASSVGFFLLLIHMRRIARRDHTRGLAKLMTFLVWGAVAVGVIGLGFSLLFMGLFVYGTATAATMTTTTAPTTQPVIGGQQTTTQVYAYEVPFDTATITKVGGTTMPAVTTLSPTATTMPGGPPAVGPPRFPSGRGLIFTMILFGSVQLFSFAWFVGGVVALFWFRRLFTRAIRQNAAHAPFAAV